MKSGKTKKRKQPQRRERILKQYSAHVGENVVSYFSKPLEVVAVLRKILFNRKKGGKKDEDV